MKKLIAVVCAATAIAIQSALSSHSAALAEVGTYQGNAAHSGYVSGQYDPATGSLAWQAAFGGEAFRGLAIGGNTVFVSGSALRRAVKFECR